MGEFIFEIPVRKGMPAKVGRSDHVVKQADYATAVGLLLYGLNQNRDHLMSMASGEIHLADSLDGLTPQDKRFFWNMF